MSDVMLQRKNMVESQIRPSDVTDRRITAAMSEIPREMFLPAGIDASLAYMDAAIPLGGPRALFMPRTLARLLQLAAVNPADNVLIVGAATGYSAALIARMARKVVALESENDMVLAARGALKALGAENVEVVQGALEAGYSASAPYHVIFIEGAVEEIPEALIAQLAPTGRLTAIVSEGGFGRACVVTKAGSSVSTRAYFEAGAGLLPGFARPKAFVL